MHIRYKHGDRNMEQSELIRLAEEAIDEHFTNIGELVDGIVDKIIDQY